MAAALWKNRRSESDLLRLLRNHKVLIVFDTETTGLSPEKDSIIELSAQKYQINDDLMLTKISQKSGYFRPPLPISADIVDLTGITNEFLTDKPAFRDKLESMERFFGTNALICGHNVQFDIRFVSAEFAREGRQFAYERLISHKTELVDTLTLARTLISKEDIENYRLMTVAKYLGVEKGLVAHNAIGDVEATARILQKFLDLCKAKETEANTAKKKIFCPRSVKFWQGYRGQSRIYVELTTGDSVFYDIRSYGWGSKTMGLDDVDIGQLETDVCKLAGVRDMDALSRFRGWITAGV